MQRQVQHRRARAAAHPMKQRRGPAAAMLESLEARAYLSLEPSLSAPLPATLVTGQKTPSAITVGLTNTSGVTIKGKYTVTVYADLGTALDGSQIQLGQFSENLPSLKAGNTTSVSLKLTMLPSMANDNYHLIAQITGSLADQGGDAAAAAGTVAIAAPFVDLSDATAFTKPASGLIVGGQSFSYSVTFTNNGNVAADGPIAFTLSGSVNADGSSAVPRFSGKETPNLEPGASKTYTVTFKTPATSAPGIYYAVVTVDPGNTFQESDTTNNSAVSATTMTIVSPLPDVVGSFTPIGTIKKGPFAGDQEYFELHITQEDPAGDLSGFADIDSIGATFSGTVNTAGKVNITLVSVGGGVQTAGETTHITGTLNKKTDILTGGFSVSDGEVGTYQPCSLPGRLFNSYHGNQTMNSTSTSLVITVTGNQPAAGTFSGTVDSELGDGLAMTGTDSEATGRFNMTVTVPNGGTPYTVSYVGVEIDGVLTGTVTDNGGDSAMGTFTATDAA